MEEDRSKLGKSSWIALGVAALGFVIFAVVFMKLQSGHDDTVTHCAEKCRKATKCHGQGSEPGSDLCEELCGLAPAKAEVCMDTRNGSCQQFSACVLEND